MAITFDLTSYITPEGQNHSVSIPISATPDTVTILVNPVYPRVVAFIFSVDGSFKIGSGAAVPRKADASAQLQVSVPQVFTVLGASAGTLTIWLIG